MIILEVEWITDVPASGHFISLFQMHWTVDTLFTSQVNSSHQNVFSKFRSITTHKNVYISSNARISNGTVLQSKEY